MDDTVNMSWQPTVTRGAPPLVPEKKLDSVYWKDREKDNLDLMKNAKPSEQKKNRQERLA